MRRVLVIGLDGATFDVMGPLIEEGYMPNLTRIISEGTAGVLNSTKPPITPAALRKALADSSFLCHDHRGRLILDDWEDGRRVGISAFDPTTGEHTHIYP